MESQKHDRARWLRTGAIAALFLFVAVFVAEQRFWEESAPGAPEQIPVHYTLLSQPGRAFSFEDLQALADDYLRRGDHAAAASYLYVGAMRSADVEEWLTLANRYGKRADWAAMREALTQVLEADPDHAEAHYELAILLMPFDLRAAYGHLAYGLEAPRYEESSRHLRELLARLELLAPAYQAARIGQALVGLERWAQAEQAFSISQTLEPSFAEAWAYLALVRAQQHKPIEASVTRALSLAPADGFVRFLVGVAWRIQGHVAEALPALEYAQSLEPANPAFALELGTLYRQMGDLSAAEYWLRYAVDLAGDDTAFLRMLAIFYAEEEYALEEAGLSVLQEAVAQMPHDGDLLAAYAWALFSTGDAEAAQQALNTALALQSENPRSLYYQGLLLQFQGQPEAARIFFERVLGLDAPAGFDRLAIRSLEQME